MLWNFKKPKGLCLDIGDALGRPTKFMSLVQIKKKYGDRGIQNMPDPPLFTGDTQMSIAPHQGWWGGYRNHNAGS